MEGPTEDADEVKTRSKNRFLVLNQQSSSEGGDSGVDTDSRARNKNMRTGTWEEVQEITRAGADG